MINNCSFTVIYDKFLCQKCKRHCLEHAEYGPLVQEKTAPKSSIKTSKNEVCTFTIKACPKGTKIACFKYSIKKEKYKKNIPNPRISLKKIVHYYLF